MSINFYSLCCHCNTRNIFDNLSQLNCKNCGAPLEEFHRLDEPAVAAEPVIIERIVEREIIREVPVTEPSRGKEKHRFEKNKRKKKKSKMKRLTDLAEDIFDIFD